jgi:mannose-1-phosphate guanylyltransferase/phosphomannomutase
MAGGEGTRLRPLTISQPKPMLPIANLPMAEHIITLLKKHGITEVVVTVAYLANTIRTYFGDGSEFGVSITYAAEETPLGTAGSVRNAKEMLDETFLVISGDVLTDVDLTELIESHERRGAMATLALKAMDNPLEFGIVITDDEGRIERFLEKPTWGQVFSDTINTGIYVLEPEVLDYVKPGVSVDFSSEVFPRPARSGCADLRLRHRGLLGRRRHARGLPLRAPRRLRGSGRSRHGRLPASARAYGSAKVQRSTPRRSSRRR